MVGRALERDVERDGQAVLTRRSHEPAEVFQRAQLRVDRLVPALIGPDGPRAARLVGLCPDAVVRALAMRAADGVDGREVEDVEAHAGDVGQPVLDLAERAVTALP